MAASTSGSYRWSFFFVEGAHTSQEFTLVFLGQTFDTRGGNKNAGVTFILTCISAIFALLIPCDNNFGLVLEPRAPAQLQMVMAVFRWGFVKKTLPIDNVVKKGPVLGLFVLSFGPKLPLIVFPTHLALLDAFGVSEKNLIGFAKNQTGTLVEVLQAAPGIPTGWVSRSVWTFLTTQSSNGGILGLEISSKKSPNK